MSASGDEIPRRLELSYHPDAQAERVRMYAAYSWLPRIWPQATRELARQIAGPRDAKPDQHVYFGREGENVTFDHASKDLMAYHLVTWLIPRSVAFLRPFAGHPRMRQVHERIQAVLGGANPSPELWVAFSSYYCQSHNREIQLEVHIEAIRRTEGVSVRILSVEEIPESMWPLRNVFRNGDS